DASFLKSKASFSSDDTHFLSANRLRSALDVVADPSTGSPACRAKLAGEDPACVPLDIFTPNGASQAALRYIDASAHRHGSTTETIAGLNSTIDLGEWGLRSPWAEESPSINVGAEYRKDRLHYVPDPQQFTGDLAGSGAAQLPVD